MEKIKRHLTRQEEFELMKLILDKFLWVGVAVMAFGFYRLVAFQEDIGFGLTIIACGALLLLIFMAMLVREYHFMKN